jgi:hypothetical protein
MYPIYNMKKIKTQIKGIKDRFAILFRFLSNLDEFTHSPTSRKACEDIYPVKIENSFFVMAASRLGLIQFR